MQNTIVEVWPKKRFFGWGETKEKTCIKNRVEDYVLSMVYVCTDYLFLFRYAVFVH